MRTNILTFLAVSLLAALVRAAPGGGLDDNEDNLMAASPELVRRSDAVYHALRIKRQPDSADILGGHALRWVSKWVLYSHNVVNSLLMIISPRNRIKKDMYQHALRIKKASSGDPTFGHALRIKKSSDPSFGHALRIKKSAFEDGADENVDGLYYYLPFSIFEPDLTKRQISRSHILRSI